MGLAHVVFSLMVLAKSVSAHSPGAGSGKCRSLWWLQLQPDPYMQAQNQLVLASMCCTSVLVPALQVQSGSGSLDGAAVVLATSIIA